MKLDGMFDETPLKWGLRGDPHLWDDLRDEVRHHPGFDTADDFLLFLRASIERAIGKPLIEGQYPYVEKFNSGGMSGGRIDCGFWLNTALPLLRFRFSVHL
ncbi:hypothetical protein ABDD95_20645 [Mucilaginibacter sp. PAMB04274]|uniref:hypothetical protein n=1 Tax=Mucilaginibacter sp. PAMB04274 TaxID=3138568 RepID=UPI0031F6F75A